MMVTLELSPEEAEFLKALFKAAQFSGNVESLQRALQMYAGVLRKLEQASVEAGNGNSQKEHRVQV